MRSWVSFSLLAVCMTVVGTARASQLMLIGQPETKSEFVALVRRAEEVRIHRHHPPANPKGMDPGRWSPQPDLVLTRKGNAGVFQQLARVSPVPSKAGKGLPV